jgi:hypothetical protein
MSSFAMVPASDTPAVAGEDFPRFFQVRFNGVDLGGPDATVIDFVGGSFNVSRTGGVVTVELSDGSFIGDEWRAYSVIRSNPLSLPSGDAPNIWGTTNSGTETASGTPAYFFLQRRTVRRAGPPGDLNILSDVVNTSPTLPVLDWVPTAADTTPFLVAADLSRGVWRLQPDADLPEGGGGNGVAFGPNGTLTIGGPGAGLRTVITRLAGFYRPIAWEYVWQG